MSEDQDRRRHCDVHEEFLVAVTKLSSDVKSMRSMFKAALGAILTITLFIAGLVATFMYEAGDLYAQVQVNATEITNHKEMTHNGR